MEAFKVSHPTDNRTHENFNGTDPLLLDGRSQIPALTGSLRQSQVVTELFLADGSGEVDFVAEDEEGGFGQIFNGEEALEVKREGIVVIEISIQGQR